MDKSASSQAPPSASPRPSLITRLLRSLMVDRGRHCFRDWFSEDEILSFRTSANLEPLFERYQERMEASLVDFCRREEGLETPVDIASALERARDETEEYKQLDKLINSMSRREVFFKMMRRRADRLWDKKQSTMDRLKQAGLGGGSKRK